MDTADTFEAKRILIVDDDPDVHDLLTVALRDTGRYLECASDGVEGLKKFEGGRWDLVITDVIMPHMDGMELLARVHSLRPETPVVVMTVDSTAEKIVSAIRDNAFSCSASLSRRRRCGTWWTAHWQRPASRTISK